MSYSRLGENKVESWGRRASFKRYIYVEELQNDGQLGRAVTCQNLLSLFFFSFLFFLFSPSRHQSTQFLNQAHGTGCMKLLYNCISLCRLPVQILEGDVWGVEEFREAFFFFFEPVSGKKFIHVFLTSANIFPSASRRSCCCRNKPKNSSGVSYSFKPISCKLKPCATWSVVLSRALVSFLLVYLKYLLAARSRDLSMSSWPLGHRMQSFASRDVLPVCKITPCV